MNDFYKPLAERTPDTQYQNSLRAILDDYVLDTHTYQGVPARTRFGMLPPMVFDLANGIPLITERDMAYWGTWKESIAEKIAFINGARTIDDIESYGCNKFWKEYRGLGTEIGLEPNDMGPGSYGPAFHDFEIPGGGTLNQYEQLVEQLTKFPYARTHFITPWKPYYTAVGPNRKVIIAPCHGWVYVRVLGEKLYMVMVQRSADVPIGVPSNMFQYAALLLMLAQVTGREMGHFSHYLLDAHVYENQVPKVQELISRKPRSFPILRLDSSVKNLFDFRIEHFSLDEYNPHPRLNIPFAR